MTTYVSCLVADSARMDAEEHISEEVEHNDEAVVTDLLQDIKHSIIYLFKSTKIKGNNNKALYKFRLLHIHEVYYYVTFECV